MEEAVRKPRSNSSKNCCKQEIAMPARCSTRCFSRGRPVRAVADDLPDPRPNEPADHPIGSEIGKLLGSRSALRRGSLREGRWPAPTEVFMTHPESTFTCKRISPLAAGPSKKRVETDSNLGGKRGKHKSGALHRLGLWPMLELWNPPPGGGPPPPQTPQKTGAGG